MPTPHMLTPTPPSPQVKVMTSIRRPKRLIVRGDDERDHPFLVKGGEDLRQDQRIEQLFGVMNILLGRDSACTRRGLQLRTYQVVPINTRCPAHSLLPLQRHTSIHFPYALILMGFCYIID